MANKRRWSRYQPPAEKRDEHGQPVRAAARPRPKATPKPARVMPPKPTPKTKSSSKSKSSSKPKPGPALGGWIGGLTVLAVIVAITVGITVAVKAGNADEPSNPDLDTTLLTEDFIGSSLAEALEVEGKDAVSVRLDEYGMRIEYFDPNARQSRYFETNDYVDGYTLRVEESFYDDYQPRPFDLSTIDAATMIAAVEDALTKTDDIYTYSLRIEADRETGDVSMVVSVSGDDTVDTTVAP